jgi:hypothetical protein
MHKEIDPINRTDPVGQWNHDKFVQDVRLMAEKILKPQPEYGWDGVVTVREDIHSLFVRSGPARMYPQAGSKILYPGNKVSVVEFVEGENVAVTVNGSVIQTPYWWKSSLGHYFWAGGTVEQPGLKKNDDILLNLQKEVNNMTPEEKASKLAEFEARRVSLEARKKELEDAMEVNKTDFAVFEAELGAFDSEPVVEVPVETPAEPEVVAEPVVEAPVEPVVEAPEAPAEVEDSKFEEMFAEFKEFIKSKLGK